MKIIGQPEPSSEVVNSEPKVLLIGYGWVGQYMGKYFTKAHYTSVEGVIRKVEDDQAVDPEVYDLAIIGVPTPMDKKTGKCDVSIVEEVVEKYEDIVSIFLIKSTVEIGTSAYLETKYGVPVCMSPEFIGETLGHPLLEAKQDNFQIIGGNPTAREEVAQMFMRVLHASAPIHLCASTEAYPSFCPAPDQRQSARPRLRR